MNGPSSTRDNAAVRQFISHRKASRRVQPRLTPHLVAAGNFFRSNNLGVAPGRQLAPQPLHTTPVLVPCF